MGLRDYVEECSRGWSVCVRERERERENEREPEREREREREKETKSARLPALYACQTMMSVFKTQTRADTFTPQPHSTLSSDPPTPPTALGLDDQLGVRQVPLLLARRLGTRNPQFHIDFACLSKKSRARHPDPHTLTFTPDPTQPAQYTTP